MEAARRDEEESLRNNPADTTLESIVNGTWVGYVLGDSWLKVESIKLKVRNETSLKPIKQ